MEQQRKKRTQHTSIFTAWLRNQYGGKRFVMAIIETGLSWATPSGAAEHTSSRGDSSASKSIDTAEHSRDADIVIGAPQHAATKFVDWMVKVVKAIDRHKKDETVQEQRRRSGDAKHTSGLTNDEKRLRAARDEARSNYAYGADLIRRVEMYEEKGKAKGKGKRDLLIRPIAWQELSWEQKWYVRQFRNGNLWEAKKTTESQYYPHSAETNRFQ